MRISTILFLITLLSGSCPPVSSQLSNGAFLPLFVEPQPNCTASRHKQLLKILMSLPVFMNGFPLLPRILVTAEVKVFTVINPSNGPGLAHSQPPADYQACIPSLVDAGAKQNTLHLLGYIDTANGQRNSVEVLMDIETYAGWDEGYRPEGVYFDNSPTGAAYLALFNEYGNSVRELFGETGMVALNPSAVPDSGYFTLSDLIVTVNEDYNIFNFSNLPLSPSTPVEKQIVILYNAPNNLDFSETVVDEISAIANIKACFITPSLKDTEYTSVPDSLFQLLGSLIASQTA